MDNTDNMLLLILNPEAGLRYARKFLPEIIALFTDYGYSLPKSGGTRPNSLKNTAKGSNA